MKILIIGGTRFLGRYITLEALNRNHDITLFNRGKENRTLFPEVETVIGDRTEDIALLGDRVWDCVIDTCGFVPWNVEPSIQYLKSRTKHYVYISSQSVYSDFSQFHIDEHSPVETISAETVDECKRTGYGPYGEYYGAMKFLCEQLIEQHMPQNVLHVRAGLISGPHDYSDRLSYWINRISQGGEVVAPGHSEQPIQLIDVRDLSSWIIQMVESRQTGVFNVTGTQTTMGHLLEECRRITDSNADFQWVEEQFLYKEQVQPWTDLPLWLPEQHGLSDGEKPPVGFFHVNINKAIHTGLSFRSLSETIADTLQWLQEERKEDWKCGLTLEKEKVLLTNWKWNQD